MADVLKPDLCIIGAGARGTELAMAARSRGAEVVLVDRGPEPGDGAQRRLHRLALMASAHRAHAIRFAGLLGLESADPKPNFRAVGEHAARVAAAVEPRDDPDRLTALGIRRVSGSPAFTDRHTLSVGDTAVRARNYLFATGDAPLVPDLPGLDAVPFFTPETILDNLRKLTHLVVIGGGTEAIELAQAYRRLGSAVSVVPQGEVLPGFDREAVAVLLRELREEGVDVLEGAVVTAIQPRSQGTGIVLQHADKSAGSLDVSHILLAMGRVAQIVPAMVEKARLKQDPLRPGLWIATSRVGFVGAAAGLDDPALATSHADTMLNRALGGAGRWDAAHVLRHVITEPPLAQVGMLDDTRLPAGAVVLRASPAEAEAARADGAPAGSLKLVVAGNGAVLGGVMVGEGATETMALLALAIARKLPIADLQTIHLPATSPAAPLANLVRQWSAGQPRRKWTDPGAALRRLRP